MACKVYIGGIPTDVKKIDYIKSDKYKINNPTLEKAKGVLKKLKEEQSEKN